MINTSAEVVRSGKSWARKSAVGKRNTASVAKLSGVGRSRTKKNSRIVGRTGRRVGRK
jgi:hypothetical protein